MESGSKKLADTSEATLLENFQNRPTRSAMVTQNNSEVSGPNALDQSQQSNTKANPKSATLNH
ncbi:hypothetical protein PCASD_01318 [Puccinia coronata f. sp. avenae]|uniref:Uncharacterized protein n=1 Tax=Puccinia coronata f. sp. avenae TaxID=200324 RepID=A0A2N5VIZ5_9BASI|nr:hypothetical protein PCASD_01318 [Puccinia coronata f. sp. avenae]